MDRCTVCYCRVYLDIGLPTKFRMKVGDAKAKDITLQGYI